MEKFNRRYFFKVTSMLSIGGLIMRRNNSIAMNVIESLVDDDFKELLLINTLNGINANASASALQGNYFYCAGQNGWFSVIDISNQEAPVLRGQVYNNSLLSAHEIEVKGNYVYVFTVDAVNPTMTVIDVTNPLLPTVVKIITDINYFRKVHAVYIVGNLLYVPCSLDPGTSGRLSIWDISNPLNPIVKGFTAPNVSLQSDNGLSIIVNNNYAYITSAVMMIMTVYDISDPTNIIYVNAVSDVRLETGDQVIIKNLYIFMPRYSHRGFVVISISNPTIPIVVADISFTGFPILEGILMPDSISTDGRYVFMSSETANTRIMVVDILNPLAPIFVANVLLTGNGSRDHEFKNGYIYQAGGASKLFTFKVIK